MEQTSDMVYEGKLISETTYDQRAAKGTELVIDGIKIDFYDAQRKIVHEVKKSNKMETAHEWQVKYYLLVLKRNGIGGATGIIEYPKLRQRKTVELTQEEEVKFTKIESDIRYLAASRTCPPVLNKPLCKRCSYYDFCYSSEV